MAATHERPHPAGFTVRVVTGLSGADIIEILKRHQTVT